MNYNKINTRLNFENPEDLNSDKSLQKWKNYDDLPIDI